MAGATEEGVEAAMTGEHALRADRRSNGAGGDGDLRAGEGRRAWLVPAGVLACGFLAVAWLALSPKPGQPVAAVFPPWWSAARAFAAAASAGGRVMRTGAWPTLVVVVPEAGGETGFGGRLGAAGAWLIVDPQSLGGCGTQVFGTT